MSAAQEKGMHFVYSQDLASYWLHHFNVCLHWTQASRTAAFVLMMCFTLLCSHFTIKYKGCQILQFLGFPDLDQGPLIGIICFNIWLRYTTYFILLIYIVYNSGSSHCSFRRIAIQNKQNNNIFSYLNLPAFALISKIGICNNSKCKWSRSRTLANFITGLTNLPCRV